MMQFRGCAREHGDLAPNSPFLLFDKLCAYAIGLVAELVPHDKNRQGLDAGMRADECVLWC